jgi:methylmalonyl-CoA/ethylmalonyl-CoA epimerase
MGLGLPHHIAVLVKDIDETIEFLSSTLGIKAENHTTYLKDMFAGKPFHVKAAHAKLGGVLLELLQPLEEDSLLGKCLKTRGEGLHHIGFRVSNWDEIVPKLEERGSKVLQGGISPHAGLNRWAHFETGSGGIILELDELESIEE